MQPCHQPKLWKECKAPHVSLSQHHVWHWRRLLPPSSSPNRYPHSWGEATRWPAVPFPCSLRGSLHPGCNVSWSKYVQSPIRRNGTMWLELQTEIPSRSYQQTGSQVFQIKTVLQQDAEVAPLQTSRGGSRADHIKEDIWRATLLIPGA